MSDADIPLPATPRLALTPRQARRAALASLGLARPRPAEPSRKDFAALVARLGMLQIDSVNVLARAHFMPGYSRLGSYDTGLLENAAYGGRRRILFEYWGHEASLIRVGLQPALRWRMERARAGQGIYRDLARFGRERRDFVNATLEEVRKRGAMCARDLGEDARGMGAWWGWSDTKRALEWLFWAGLLTTSGRRPGFDRVYDLPERVLPRAILDAPTPEPEEAVRILLRTAATALGVATLRDLRSYFRIAPGDAAPRVAELVEEGALVPVAVKGWTQQAFMAAGARIPRRPEARALVSPFDPLLWERDRVERLFGLRYRIEIYTPAHKREHGYYVLPFLLGDAIAARVDLKADRQARRLYVLSAHSEPGHEQDHVCSALAGELRLLAAWLGLDEVHSAARGDLAAALARSLA